MTRRYWVTFGTFCLLSVSGWLLPPVAPRTRCLTFTLFGFSSLFISGRRSLSPRRDIAKLVLFSILLVGIPDALSVWAQTHVSGSLVTAMLALVPIILVVVAAQAESDKVSSATRTLVPAVLGLGGVLLLLPVDLPASTIGRIAIAVLLAAEILIACSSIAIHRVLHEFSMPQGIAVVCLSNALFALAEGLQSGWRGTADMGSVLPALMMGGTLALLVVLLRGMDPVRFGARYFVIPLLTIVEGYLIVRPELTVRMCVGAALIASGAAFLLLGRQSEEVSSLSLR